MTVLGPKRHTQKTGDISEQAAITRLLQCGYLVLQPIGQMHRYDLVAIATTIDLQRSDILFARKVLQSNDTPRR